MALLLIQACTTQKKRSDLSTLGKAYHNMTSHYNGYFNANELLVQSLVDLDLQHQDNYNQRLDLFEYVAADNPQAVAPNLDKAIEKVGLVVNQHPYSQWTDDCYLLLGQAQFLKKDYETAEETLRYTVNEYSPEKMAKMNQKTAQKKKKKKKKGVSSSKKKNASAKKNNKSAAQKRKEANRATKKRKKKKSRGKKKSSSKKKTTPKVKEDKPKGTGKKPKEIEKKPEETGLISLSKDGDLSKNGNEKTGPFKQHEPVFQNAQLWLAKVLIERDNYIEAQGLLSKLEKNPKLYSSVAKELPAVQAYAFLKTDNTSQAVVYLEKAIETTKNRALKGRYAFVMGQLYQENGNGEAAYVAFEKALKYSPDFEMQFSSKLKIAQNEWIAGKGSAEEAVAKLEKMLNEAKNEEFKDQIYYALADVALKQGDRAAAMNYLSLSLQSNLSNKTQKAEAYYQLGTLFYENQEYVDAKNYYDSTLQVMPKTDKRFTTAEKRAIQLKEIAEYIQLIALNDSLLVIAEMSDDDRRTMAYDIKKAQEESLKAAKEKGKAGGGTDLYKGGVKKSSFFAYDVKAVKRGKREFQRKWGDRVLEDNWQRLNKQGGSIIEDDVTYEEAVAEELTEDEIKKLLEGVPTSKGEKTAMILAIKEAMAKLGNLYRERLANNEKAVKILEKLNVRYPASSYELESWYILHLAFRDLENAPKAKEYYDKLVNKYPTTNYTKMLTDPDFAAKYMDEERRFDLKFDEAYQLFSDSKYADAFIQSQGNIKELFGKHPLKPRYALLMAICTGNTKGKEAYIEELNKLIATYPNTAEEKRAKEILRILGVRGATLPGGGSGTESDFEFKENALHYVIIVFNENVKLNDYKIVVSDYNRKYHKLDKIRISNVFLGKKNDTPVLVLRRFKNKDIAMKYYDGIQKNIEEYIDKSVDYSILPITQSNYRKVLKARSVAGYQNFFDDNYLE